MKIRNGFVSNSSSSSFVIYGVKVKKSKIMDLLKEESISDESKTYEIEEKIKKKYKLDCSSDTYYFERDHKNNPCTHFIIGKEADSLEDGDFCEYDFKCPDEKNTKNKLKELGIDDEIKLYVKMISNDNF